MTKKISRMIAVIMLLVSAGFIWYALSHPTASFPWGNTITYLLYVVYVIVMIVLFAAPFKKKK